ncbi:MAG: cobalamin B12-binding domain-containing protein [Candidatus Rokubacteria bacterium]|nr:cobalamin B12-binding domain-containing protein [Candidatus Rokubacteria bacterium]
MAHTDGGSKPIRVLLAKPGLDGHDRGVKVIARALRDAGFEALYTGLHQTCEQIVAIAVQEDVDAIGVSILSGGHMGALSRIMELLREQHVADDILVVAGGFIPDEREVAALKALGVREIFDVDTRTDTVVTFLREAVAERRAGAARR